MNEGSMIEEQTEDDILYEKLKNMNLMGSRSSKKEHIKILIESEHDSTNDEEKRVPQIGTFDKTKVGKDTDLKEI